MRTLSAWCVCIILALPASGIAAQSATAKPANTRTATAPAAAVNVNTASEADLEALPGVGPATAKKIIAGRPYASAADLSKAGLTKATLDKITPLVVFGAAAGAAASPAKPVAAPASAAASTPASSSARSSSAASAAPVTAQTPPVKGMVWVNLDTKVFHREGDRFYGKTKNGKFMSEAEATKAGYREAKAGAVGNGKP